MRYEVYGVYVNKMCEMRICVLIFFCLPFNVLLSLICNNHEAPLSDTAMLVLVDLTSSLLVTFATLHYFLQHGSFSHGKFR